MAGPRPPDLRMDAAPPWTVPRARSVEFDAAGNRLLITCDSRIRALRIEDGAEDLRFEDDGCRVERRILVHPAAGRAVALGPDNELVTWDLATGAILTRVRFRADRPRLDAISPDGRRVLLALHIPSEYEYEDVGDDPPDAGIAVVDVATAEVLDLEFPGFQPPTTSAGSFFADGRIVVLDRRWSVRLFAPDGALLRDLPTAPANGEEAAAASGRALEDGGLLVRHLRGWFVRDLERGEARWTLEPDFGNEHLFDGRRLLVRLLSQFGTPECTWVDVSTGATSPADGYGPLEGRMAERNGTLAQIDASGAVRLLRRNSRRSLAIPLDALSAPPSAIAASADGATLLAGGSDGSLRVLADGRVVRALPGHGGLPVVAAGFLSNGRAWTANAQCWRLWRTSDWRLLREISIPDAVEDPAVSPGGAFIAWVNDGMVVVRRTDGGDVHREVGLGSQVVVRGRGRMLDDGRTLFAGNENGMFRWDLETGEITARAPFGAEAEGRVRANAPVASADGTRVLLAVPQSSGVFLWEPDRGTLRRLPHAWSDPHMAWLPDGRIALARESSEVLGPRNAIAQVTVLTPRGEGKPFEESAELVGHDLDAAITAMTVAGDRLITGGEDRRICIWRLPA